MQPPQTETVPFHHLLYKFRKRAGLKQSGFELKEGEEAYSITRDTYGAYERGEKPVPWEAATAILDKCKALAQSRYPVTTQDELMYWYAWDRHLECWATHNELVRQSAEETNHDTAVGTWVKALILQIVPLFRVLPATNHNGAHADDLVITIEPLDELPLGTRTVEGGAEHRHDVATEAIPHKHIRILIPREWLPIVITAMLVGAFVLALSSRGHPGAGPAQFTCPNAPQLIRVMHIDDRSPQKLAAERCTYALGTNKPGSSFNPNKIIADAHCPTGYGPAVIDMVPATAPQDVTVIICSGKDTTPLPAFYGATVRLLLPDPHVAACNMVKDYRQRAGKVTQGPPDCPSS